MLVMGRVDDWVQVIRGEFEEVPDLQVTAEEARQRWDLEVSSLEVVLDGFVDVGFLRRSPEGAYSRWPDPAVR